MEPGAFDSEFSFSGFSFPSERLTYPLLSTQVNRRVWYK